MCCKTVTGEWKPKWPVYTQQGMSEQLVEPKYSPGIWTNGDGGGLALPWKAKTVRVSFVSCTFGLKKKDQEYILQDLFPDS